MTIKHEPFTRTPALAGALVAWSVLAVMTAVVDPPSPPGERIVLACLMDLVCAVSSCPQDIIPGNGLVPSEFRILVGMEG